jgi:hypothetical protein
MRKGGKNVFQQACSQIRNSIYGVMCCSQLRNRMNCTNGTAFMIAPGVLVTAAHVIHVEHNPRKPVHRSFLVIQAPEVGQQFEQAQLITEDTIRDIALLQIENSRSNHCVTLEPDIVPVGTGCGSLGFPLSEVEFRRRGRNINRILHLIERFQGAHISAFHTQADSSGRQHYFYETDAVMYRGSSGCPGFLANANVFGMHIKVAVERPRTGQDGLPDIESQTITRLAISLWVPSMEIITFARDNGITL